MPTRYHPRLAALAADAAAAPADQLPKLRKLLEAVLRDECQRQEAPFVNLSQAIGLIAYERNLPAALRQQLQALRLSANLVVHESYAGTPAEVASGFAAVASLVLYLTGAPYLGPTPPKTPTQPETEAGENEVASAKNFVPDASSATAAWRVNVLHANEATGELTVEMATPADGRPAGPFRLVLPEAYENVLSLAAALHPTLHLIGPVLLPDGSVRARRIVLEPDYLVSVTTVAECAQRDGTIPEWALLNAFLPDETSRPLVLGNLVNLLLDEEVSHAARQAEKASLNQVLAKNLVPAGEDETSDPAAADAGAEADEPEFNLDKFLKQRLFRSSPLSLSTLPEFQTRTGVPELLNDLRRHHRTLRETRVQGFVAQSLTGYQQEPLRLADCFLEPTFLSATYGLQGRLDLLHESATGYDLVELKSSTKVPYAEPWSNHAAQAQLYRLLLESVFGADGETAGRGRTSILYSNAASGQPAVRRVDQDQDMIDRLLSARNQLVGTELQLARATGPRQTAHLLAPVLQPNLMALPSFGKAKAEKVANAWAAADTVERAYCLELARFTAREMRLTLLGDEARPGDAGGQAGLWLLPQARKHQNFSLLDDLVLLEDHSNADDGARDGLGPHLIFQRPADGREVNFRAGDTLILYPRRRNAKEGENADSSTTNGNFNSKTPAHQLTVLDAQVVKVVLAEDLGANGQVVLSVRNRRMAPRYLLGHSHWALEPDTYDTFRREWAGLSSFLCLAPERRRRLLARTGPREPEGWAPTAGPATTATEVVARALAAPDWFVLCGPPGTGKTRAVLRELAVSLYKQDKQVLLAAYTNRAVDEICEQLVQAGLPFIRVGSRLGTAPVYRPYLLDNMLRDCTNRQAVRDRLGTCPFYVGTVASLLGKPELFMIKQFDLAVVDEASQVLESPMLALLAKVRKFILIGDHRQLPAVVAQEPETSAVAPEVAELLRGELGLTNLRNSYFERLFRRAEAQWPHAHGTLADQYRMHQELAVLVNQDFYDNQLRCPLPWQSAPLDRSAWPTPDSADGFTVSLRTQRVVFVPTRRQPEDLSMKESDQEAELAARAAAYVAQGYGPLFNPESTLGIIASYRNQAARIRARLAQLAVELSLPALAQVSVDTVERYQGSQREVIIVSFCCHHEHQLELMVSPDETGQVDRKLNVALTRARQQLVLLGNEEILSRAPHHAALLARVR
ncbi:AAA domain-containing protein [Hymenobacter sp. BT770]|uniref:DEAD/DEAH box helicase n=1 Tax=Hymenobacter sp. BT770 TaxID=2886942 RepID=UPI001D0F7724|nr:AAA domain-containing protein [Hymenobacter sp. BT770]MCC3152584.1 ATP-binding protein [Hymenobacter sp. BT770]MDO3414439.1 AAA domain-containing protein [Hymenobacter sp. BT770]